MNEPSASLADLIRAFEILRPQDDATREAIARLLRIEPTEPAEPLLVAQETKKDQGAPSVKEGRRQGTRWEALPAGDRTELRAVLETEFTAPRRLPIWLKRTAPLPETATAKPVVPVPDSLLEPCWTRAVLSGALATLSERGPLDVPQLVRGIMRGVLLRSVPRQPWPTLTRGAQVLVDRSEAMHPFLADQEDLLDKLRAVVGRERLEILRFERPGDKAGIGPRRTWKSYFEHCRPRPGTAVLALTDLGIGERRLGTRPIRPEDWRTFAADLLRLGSPLLALVPYARKRWPEGLERALTILPWDRATSVRTVRRAIGRALSLPNGTRA